MTKETELQQPGDLLATFEVDAAEENQLTGYANDDDDELSSILQEAVEKKFLPEDYKLPKVSFVYFNMFLFFVFISFFLMIIGLPISLQNSVIVINNI